MKADVKDMAEACAFPIMTVDRDGMATFHTGLTKRELLTAMMAQGFRANPAYQGPTGGTPTYSQVAFDAVRQADELLELLAGDR